MIINIKQLLQRYEGDICLALATYNAGSKAVTLHSGIPPLVETQDFLARVMEFYAGYKEID